MTPKILLALVISRSGGLAVEARTVDCALYLSRRASPPRSLSSKRQSSPVA